MTEQWQELKETIIELRDNDGTGTQQEVCKFLANYMDVLEKQMQEPSGDLISREATLEKAVYTETEEGWYGYTVDVNYIKSLPSVKQEPNWVSVRERLPEDGQSVLFCDIDNDIMAGYHVKGRPDTHFSQDGTYEDMKNVRAWMPLPKPYEPQE